jgi:hypothetical protein
MSRRDALSILTLAEHAIRPSSTPPTTLDRSTRSRLGRGGQPIEFFDDWFTLVHVIFFIHTFTKAAFSPDDMNLWVEKDSLFQMCGVSSFAGQEEMQIFVDRLKRVLNDAETAAWVVNKSLKFEQSLDGL